MDHGGEAARPTTVASADLRIAGAVQGGEMGTGTFHGQRSTASARRAGFEPSAAAYHNSAEFARHVRATAGRGEVPVDVLSPAPSVVYTNIGEFWRQLGLVDVAPLGPHLDGAVQVLHNYGYAVLQPRPGAGHGVVLVGLLPSGVGAVNNGGYYGLQPRPDIGHGEVLVNLLPDGAGHGESYVGQLPVPGGGVTAYDDYFYYALQPRPGAGNSEVLFDVLPDGAGHGESFVGQLPVPGGGGALHGYYGYYLWQHRLGAGRGEVLVDQLPNGAGHGEVFVGLLPGGVGVDDDYGYYAWQPRPSAGRGEVLSDGAGHGVMLVGLLLSSGGTMHNNYGYNMWQLRPGAGHGEVLPDAAGVVFDGSGNFERQTLPAPGTRGADGITGAPRSPNLSEGYDNRGLVAQHLCRLLPFAGIGASSVAISGLAAGPGSPAAAFHLFVLVLGGMFLVILHVLRA